MTLVPFPTPASATAATPAAWRAPQTVEDTGLPHGFLAELLAKTMYERGLGRLTELATALCLSGAVVEALAGHLRREGLLEVARRGAHDADVHYDLTHAGRQRAAEWLARHRHCGPAPVPLAQYVRRIEAQSVGQLRVTQAQVRQAFDGLHVDPTVQDQVGQALDGDRPILLHGVPGSGKTWLAEQIHRLLPGTVAVPHAIHVAGEVVRVFDPHWHTPLGDINAGRTPLDSRERADARWVSCRRPCVMAGGELTLSMLDLSWESGAGTYEAPPHLKANNGLFIVDDLGRQRVTPRELMNRWIVPMERRHDHLVLRSGAKFTVPFDLVLVFATNLGPAELDDAAFLRRLGHKIGVGPMGRGAFLALLRDECTRQGLVLRPEAADLLLDRLYPEHGRERLPAHAAELPRLAASRCRYLGEPPVLTPAAMQHAWDSSFGVKDITAGRVRPPGRRRSD